MTEAVPLIVLSNIIKKYHVANTESIVLDDVSLTIASGDMLAIVGASGSGKSSLMNIIGLLDKAESGSYLLQGVDVDNLNCDQLAVLRNQGLGFVFQQFNLLPRFSAEQNVALPLIYRNLPAHIIKQRVLAALAHVGMEAFSDRRPTQLSGGQQQRVAIARALVGEPQAILADEPTGALDSCTGKEIMSLFLALHAEGRTIIMVTHDEQIALQCVRRIAIADGKIIAESKQ